MRVFESVLHQRRVLTDGEVYKLHITIVRCHGLFILSLDKGQYLLNLFLGAYDTQQIAWENAHLARRNGVVNAATLDVNQVDAVAGAQIQVTQAVTHKGAVMPHGHIGQMQVAHQIDVTARTAVLALVDVVDKAFLDVGDTTAQPGGDHREKDDHGNDEKDGSPYRYCTGINALQDRADEDHRQQGADNRHDHEGHIGNRPRRLDKAFLLAALDVGQDDGGDKRAHDGQGGDDACQAPPGGVPDHVKDEGHQVVAAHGNQCDDNHRINQRPDDKARND